MKEQRKYTPGPWLSEYCGKDRIKVSKVSDKRRIATIDTRTRIMDESNAALIAAAPDLLAALETLTARAVQHLPQNATSEGLENCDILAAARSAICKAGHNKYTETEHAEKEHETKPV